MASSKPYSERSPLKKETNDERSEGLLKAICSARRPHRLRMSDLGCNAHHDDDETKNVSVTAHESPIEMDGRVQHKQDEEQESTKAGHPMGTKNNGVRRKRPPNLRGLNYDERCFSLIRTLIITHYKFPDGKVSIDLSSMTGLETLHMVNCGIVTFEERFSKSLPRSVTAVNLGQNQLTSFPDFLKELPLRRLTVSDNPISYISHEYPAFIPHLRSLNMERLNTKALPHWVLNLCLSMASFRDTTFCFPRVAQVIRAPNQVEKVKRLEHICFTKLLKLYKNPKKIPGNLKYHFYVCCKCRQTVFENRAVAVCLTVPIRAFAGRWRMSDGFPKIDEIACHAVFCSMECSLDYQDLLKKCYGSSYH